MLEKIKELFKEIPGRCTLSVECKDYSFYDDISNSVRQSGFDVPDISKDSFNKSIEEGKDCSIEFQLFEGNIIIKYGKY